MRIPCQCYYYFLILITVEKFHRKLRFGNLYEDHIETFCAIFANLLEDIIPKLKVKYSNLKKTLVESFPKCWGYRYVPGSSFSGKLFQKLIKWCWGSNTGPDYGLYSYPPQNSFMANNLFHLQSYHRTSFYQQTLVSSLHFLSWECKQTTNKKIFLGDFKEKLKSFNLCQIFKYDFFSIYCPYIKQCIKKTKIVSFGVISVT